jgi:uncharacterized protein YybS (DUF2232 family)
MKGEGAVVFCSVFVIIFLISLADTSIPPGQVIYNKLNLPASVTTYKITGAIHGDVFIEAVLNGVIYGFVVWLVFAILTFASRNASESLKKLKT